MSNTEAAPKSGRKKLLSAEAMRILSLLAGEPVDENSIAKSEQGRPFFPGREVDFNIAHSGSVAAVSLVKGAALRTGCDIELIRPRPGAQEIAKTFFSAAERNYLYQHGKFNESGFYEIWTLKECYLKLRGLSVFDMPDCPSFINDEGKRAFCASLSCPLSRTVPSLSAALPGAAPSGALSFRLYELSGGGDERYILATAIEGTEQSPPEIRWFSQSSLACKMTAEIKAALNPAETVRPKI